MGSPSKRTIQLAAAFLQIANRYMAEGYIEYLLWEVVEGLRDRPYVFLDPLPPEEMEVLRSLRDEAKLWFYWGDGRWSHCPVDEWRQHASVCTAKEVMNRLCNQRG